jgi:hypothetical protein
MERGLVNPRKHLFILTFMFHFAKMLGSDDLIENGISLNWVCQLFNNFAKMRVLDSEYSKFYQVVADLLEMEKRSRAFSF